MVWCALYLALGIILVIERCHFLVGVMLELGRWVYVCIAILMIYKTFRTRNLWGSVFLIVGVVAVLLEFGITKLNEAQLIGSKAAHHLSIITFNVFYKNECSDSSIATIKKHLPEVVVVQEILRSDVYVVDLNRWCSNEQFTGKFYECQ